MQDELELDTRKVRVVRTCAILALEEPRLRFSLTQKASVAQGIKRDQINPLLQQNQQEISGDDVMDRSFRIYRFRGVFVYQSRER